MPAKGIIPPITSMLGGTFKWKDFMFYGYFKFDFLSCPFIQEVLKHQRHDKAWTLRNGQQLNGGLPEQKEPPEAFVNHNLKHHRNSFTNTSLLKSHVIKAYAACKDSGRRALYTTMP